jgi:hypothetical protein
MTQSTAAARALPRPQTRPAARPAATPRLRVVAPVPGRSRTGLAVLSVTLLVVGLLTLLMLNISIGKGAYTLTELRRAQLQASEQQQALAEQVEERSAPQRLAARAKKLGMVPAPNTAFVRLSDGRVVGRAAPATAPPKPKASTPRKKTTSRTTAGRSTTTTKPKPRTAGTGTTATTSKPSARKPSTETAATTP